MAERTPPEQIVTKACEVAGLNPGRLDDEMRAAILGAYDLGRTDGRPAKPDRRFRRAGAPWRVLVHTMEPGGWSGDSWHIASDRRFGGGDGQDSSGEIQGRTWWSRNLELPGTDLDEVVVSKWLHIEQMDTGLYWMNIGGVTVWIRSDRDGRPKHVTVYGPLDYAEPVQGCEYECAWTDPPVGEDQSG